MTRYQGGKKQIGKAIHDAILKELDKRGVRDDYDAYFEPFVGMCGVMKYFGEDDEYDLSACDANPDLILMWQALVKGWKPSSTCSEEKYFQLKKSRPSKERGLYGHACSFSGGFFAGYDQRCSKNVALKPLFNTVKCVENVDFLDAGTYEDFDPQGSIIYCDPPYKGSYSMYNDLFNFDTKTFWSVMNDWSKDNIVFVSERTAPKGVKKIWSKKVTRNFAGTKNNYSENLYVL